MNKLIASLGRLVVDPFFCGRDQAGTNSSELVAQLDGLLEGPGETVELPDDDVVEDAVVAGDLGETILPNSARVPAVSMNVAVTVSLVPGNSRCNRRR